MTFFEIDYHYEDTVVSTCSDVDVTMWMWARDDARASCHPVPDRRDCQEQPTAVTYSTARLPNAACFTLHHAASFHSTVIRLQRASFQFRIDVAVDRFVSLNSLSLFTAISKLRSCTRYTSVYVATTSPNNAFIYHERTQTIAVP